MKKLHMNIPASDRHASGTEAEKKSLKDLPSEVVTSSLLPEIAYQSQADLLSFGATSRQNNSLYWQSQAGPLMGALNRYAQHAKFAQEGAQKTSHGGAVPGAAQNTVRPDAIRAAFKLWNMINSFAYRNDSALKKLDSLEAANGVLTGVLQGLADPKRTIGSLGPQGAHARAAVSMLLSDMMRPLYEWVQAGSDEYKVEMRQTVANSIEKAILAGGTSLDLARCHTDSLPDLTLYLPNLQSLNLFNNRLSEIPECIFGLPHLRQLDLAVNPMTAIPADIQKLTHLRELDVSDTGIRALPEQLATLQALEKLSLLEIHNDCLLADSVVWRLEQLKRLSIGVRGHGRLVMPVEIRQLQNLEALFFVRTQIDQMPDVMGELPKLRRLVFDRCVMNAIPNAVYQITHLTALTVNGSNVSVLPEAFGNLQSLEYLNLNENELSDFPEALLRLGRLTCLTLADNPLFFLPSEIGKMTALQRLGLSKMLLAEVPVELCSLPNLKFLDLSSNPRLNELPQEIRSLKKMERLNLAGTNIADIPPEIVESLKTLVLFDFPAVRIARRLPEALWLSQSIEELDLRNDGIRATAEDLARLPNLKILRVRPGEEEGSLSLNALQSALPNCKIDTRGAFDSYHWFEEEGT